MFHHFPFPVDKKDLPEYFTYPFNYIPHHLSVKASEIVYDYLNKKDEWEKELQEGKMFGVLIVEDSNNDVGFITAFSGNILKQNNHDYFVPPVFDLLKKDGFFKLEEAEITLINDEINNLSNDPEYINLKNKLLTIKETKNSQLLLAKKNSQKARAERAIRRESDSSQSNIDLINKESQFEKAEIRRLEKSFTISISLLETDINVFQQKIESLKKERKIKSAQLQMKIFNRFIIHNGNGDIKGLSDIFQEQLQKLPPAGAGECAAPKLLQYAFLNNLRPVTMAEFWYGNSPKKEVRIHGNFYPSCKSKCEPILNFMLQGLNVEENPLLKRQCQYSNLEIIYSDKSIIVINKPSGMLSVKGKTEETSVYDFIKIKYPETDGPIIVHRLDMDTSGLMVLAKNKETHKLLQKQFLDRTVKKRYKAILDGIIKEDKGIISLPLRPDFEDRPRQLVDFEFGKEAITEYSIDLISDNKTKIYFHPLTGRTHQLRVHSAHSLGLNSPILGDPIYGKKKDRLYLHAEYLEFKHPETGEIISFNAKAPF